MRITAKITAKITVKITTISQRAAPLRQREAIMSQLPAHSRFNPDDNHKRNP